MRRVGRVLALGVLLGSAQVLAGAPDSDREAREGLTEPLSPLTSEGDRLAALRASEREFLLGLAAQDQGQPSAAEEAYARAIALDPGFVEARVNRARALMALGRLQEAEQALDRAIASRSDYPPAYAARGLLLLLRGDGPRARSELERALLLDPESVEARVNLASLLITQRSLALARPKLERALELDPQSVEAVLDRALLEDLSGNGIEAVFFYGRYLDLAPWDDTDRRRVERRLETLGPTGGISGEERPPEAPDSRADEAGASQAAPPEHRRSD